MVRGNMRLSIPKRLPLLLVQCSFSVVGSFFVFFSFLGSVEAAFKTWDVEGADDNWSTAANWSGDSVPGVGDIAVFDGTGQSDSDVDTSFTTTVSGIKMGLAFTGTVTLGRPLGISGSLIISGGTFAPGDETSSTYA